MKSRAYSTWLSRTATSRPAAANDAAARQGVQRRVVQGRVAAQPGDRVAQYLHELAADEELEVVDGGLAEAERETTIDGRPAGADVGEARGRLAHGRTRRPMAARVVHVVAAAHAVDFSFSGRYRTASVNSSAESATMPITIRNSQTDGK